MSHRIALTALLLAAAGCATELTPEQLEAREQAKAAQVFADDPRRGEQVKNLCFASQIDSFGQTTKRAVVVREGRDHYLIETFPGCFDLDFAQGLAIDSFSSCLSKGDRILAFDTPFGNTGHNGVNQSCLVKAIYEWDEDAGKEENEAEETTEEETVEVAALK